MKKYKSPIVTILAETGEGVYAASGTILEENPQEEVKEKCRFGRKEANAGSDTCQACSYSGGVRDDELPGESLKRADFNGCVDGMPEK